MDSFKFCAPRMANYEKKKMKKTLNSTDDDLTSYWPIELDLINVQLSWAYIKRTR